MANFKKRSREISYTHLSDMYAITNSPLLVELMFRNYRDDEILMWEDNANILYTLFKKFPKCFNIAIKDGLRQFLLLELTEEYKLNSGITDVVMQFLSEIAESELIAYQAEVVDLIDIAIRHMRAQSFEIVPYTINNSDIRQMIAYLLEPIRSMNLTDARRYLISSITEDNFSFIIEELACLFARPVESPFTEAIELYTEVLRTVKEIAKEKENIDYDDENYNPLEDNSLTEEEMITLAYKYSPFDIFSFPKQDVMKIITSIRNLLIQYRNDDKYKDDIYEVCYKFIEPLLQDIKIKYDVLMEQNKSFELIIKEMNEIEELEWRIPRVSYLTSSKFDIEDYIYEPVLFQELKVMKDIRNIEQEYGSWFDAIAVQNSKELYSPLVYVDIDKMLKFIPIEEFDKDRNYDEFIDIENV